MTNNNTFDRRAIGAGLIAAGAFALARPAQAAEQSGRRQSESLRRAPRLDGHMDGRGHDAVRTKGRRRVAQCQQSERPRLPAVQTGLGTRVSDVPQRSGEAGEIFRSAVARLSRRHDAHDVAGARPAIRAAPEQVWIIYERPDVRYIYTDGRPFPPKDELWPTFEGYSIGHWEGDTLVVQTVSIRGGIPIDRTGAALSDEARVTERIRKTDAKTLQSDITIEDPVALTGPWKVTRRYTRRDEQYPRMENVSSLENNRNPVVNGETKVLLAGDSDPSSPYPDDLRRVAVPRFPKAK
jgi:hypothetical protein